MPRKRLPVFETFRLVFFRRIDRYTWPGATWEKVAKAALPMAGIGISLSARSVLKCAFSGKIKLRNVCSLNVQSSSPKKAKLRTYDKDTGSYYKDVPKSIYPWD